MFCQGNLAPRATLSHGSHIDLDLKFLKNYLLGVLCRAPASVYLMELLLNLTWLLFALPAYWLWRGARSAPAGRKFNSLQCLLTLGCLLVILFPVISATDDLCAMQTETEESPASKRTIRQISSDKTPAWKWQTPPALTAKISYLILSDQGWLPTLSPDSSIPAMPPIERTGRAPPASFPA